MVNNRIQLSIAGVSLIVSTPEEEAYVRRIAESVDRDMHAILTETKASVTSAALLLAVDYMDRFQKANRSATNMRTQIKGYLSDAASAKLLFDEEKKRSDTLTKENKELREKVEQLSVIASNHASIPKREDIDALLSERDLLSAQLKNADKRLQEQNERLLRQEEDLEQIRRIQGDDLQHVGVQSEDIARLEKELQSKQEEADHLLKELKTLEEMISEDVSSYEQLAFSGDLPDKNKEQPEVFDPVAFEPTVFDAVYDSMPPLYRPDPVRDATYDIDDMPNLNWTENI